VPINVAGVPAMSIPVGKTKTGLPIGAQLIGKWWNENILFEVGKALEN
jgi:aspartyl-tRNA(Asn)/glutamyl-tRNA(Gln) amidotransferase subunit A